MQNKQFREILKRNPELHTRLNDIEHRAYNSWLPLLGHSLGSYDGVTHLHNVERNADQIVPDSAKDNFSDGEIFLLLTSILLHDLGKVVAKFQPKGWRPCQKMLESEVEKQKIEWEHHCASKKIIDDYWAELGFPDRRVAGYCGLLAYAHCMNKPLTRWHSCLGDADCPLGEPKEREYRITSLDHYGVLRIPMLAAILRLADETQNQASRSLQGEVFKIFQDSGQDLGKAFRRHIEDVEFNERGGCVILHIPRAAGGAKGLSTSNISGLISVIEKSVDALDNWGVELSPLGVTYERLWVEYGGKLYLGDRAFADTQFELPEPGREPKPEGKEAQLLTLYEFLTELEKELMGAEGYAKTSFSALEARMGRELEEFDRWLIEYIGSSQYMVHLLCEGDQLSVQLQDKHNIGRNFDRLKCWLHWRRPAQEHDDDTLLKELTLEFDAFEQELQNEQDAKKQCCPRSCALSDSDLANLNTALSELAQGTAGFKEFLWKDVEAKFHRALSHNERIEILGGKVKDFRVQRGQKEPYIQIKKINGDEVDKLNPLAFFGDLKKVLLQMAQETGYFGLNAHTRFQWTEIASRYRALHAGKALSSSHKDLARNWPVVRKLVDEWQDQN